MTKIKTLTIQFNTPLKRRELPLFRGAIIAAISTGNILFHNHNEGSTLRYAYPLIQYKRIGGKAAIVCIEEGVEAIGELLVAESNGKMKIGEKEETFSVSRVNALQTNVQCWESIFEYRIRDWLPFNESNYKIFCEEASLTNRIKKLENILIGNILSFAKGINLHFEQQIEVSIKTIDNIRKVKYKRVSLQCMDISFKTNISLPNFIGLGKHASVGFGIITKVKSKDNHQNNIDI